MLGEIEGSWEAATVTGTVRQEGWGAEMGFPGIDRRVKKHEIATLNETGSIIARSTIPHQASGFEKLNKTREQVATIVFASPLSTTA